MKLEKGALGKSSVLLSFTGCWQPELARRAAPRQVAGGSGLRLSSSDFCCVHQTSVCTYICNQEKISSKYCHKQKKLRGKLTQQVERLPDLNLKWAMGTETQILSVVSLPF